MKYEVDLYKNGVTSPIDTVEAPHGYTAEDYVRDCDANADEEWCEMLHDGQVILVAIEE